MFIFLKHISIFHSFGNFLFSALPSYYNNIKRLISQPFPYSISTTTLLSVFIHPYVPCFC